MSARIVDEAPEVGIDVDIDDSNVASLSVGESSMGYSALIDGQSYMGRVFFEGKIPRVVLNFLLRGEDK